MRRPIRVAEITLAFPCAARATGGQGTIGPLRRFFGDFLSLVKESHPSETGHAIDMAGSPSAQAPRTIPQSKPLALPDSFPEGSESAGSS